MALQWFRVRKSNIYAIHFFFMKQIRNQVISLSSILDFLKHAYVYVKHFKFDIYVHLIFQTQVAAWCLALHPCVPANGLVVAWWPLECTSCDGLSDWSVFIDFDWSACLTHAWSADCTPMITSLLSVTEEDPFSPLPKQGLKPPFAQKSLLTNLRHYTEKVSLIKRHWERQWDRERERQGDIARLRERRSEREQERKTKRESKRDRERQRVTR